MDLGDIYDIVDTALGGWLPGGVPVGTSLPQVGLGGFGTPPISPPPPNFPVPISPGGMGPPPGGGGVSCRTECGPYPVLKRVCGEYRWVYPKKKRRKQLFTQRDAAQLSSLLNIAGNGGLAKSWIATHS